MEFRPKPKYAMDDLLDIMKLLRSPEGCPWDREQTHQSIRVNFIEEVYEAAEAIDLDDAELLQEELGDVLLQVVFHAQMESERKVFDFADVVDGICKKLIVRHPHIFADVVAETPAEVLRNWEDIKQQQKGQTKQIQALESVPKTLPSLMRSAKIQHRAAKVGFDYPDAGQAFNHMRSELEELSEAISRQDQNAIEEEFGDLLFSAVNVSRFLKVNAENALEKACNKFIRRFSQVEQIAEERGIDMKSAGIDSLDSLWGEVKNMEL